MKKILTIVLLLILISPTLTAFTINNITNQTQQKIVNDTIRDTLFGKTYMVEMRDGVKLATDVYRPFLRKDPHGTILIRLPYDKDSISFIGFIMALLGWPTVIQDMRGKHESEGETPVFRHSNSDGYDTIAWITNQTWSNGRIATIGPSALGIDQYLVAGSNPPNLACQSIQVATPHLYDAIYQGGEFREELVVQWLEENEGLEILEELWINENFTWSFWGNETIYDDWENVSVPAIHLGGWYDIYLQGIIDGYTGYQNLGGTGAQGKSKLIIGPWTHDGFYTRKQGELTYPVNSIDTFSLKMFFDMIKEFTMDGPNKFDDYPAVSYYVMGDVDDPTAPGNEWRYADDWPIPYNENSWYFHENGILSTSLPEDYEPLNYTYNPINPVPTIGGQNLNIEAGPYDQSPVENRDDVLVFTSETLNEPYEATGPLKAKLYVSSNSSDTDFTVKLTDVYPDGRSMLITDGILRMRKRNGTDHWELIEPGETYEIEVDLGSISYIWNTGHKIRVAVSSSNYPRFLNNPNTVDGIYQNTTYNIAQNTLYLDGIHPSCLIFPLIQ
jgi:predicted acyl esterase